MYYVRELNSHELGFRQGLPNKAGRFILVTNNYRDFFPPLSRTITNDNVLLPIIPPFSNNKIYSSFVYHNDKFNTQEGTRNEHRIYLNKSIDPNNYFQPGDIVIFDRIETGEVMPVYKLYRFGPNDLYREEVEHVFNNVPRRGAHAFIEKTLLPFIPDIVLNEDEIDVVIPDEIIDEVEEQQQEILDNGTEIEDVRGASLFNSISFRDFVLHAYGYKCAITGKSIRYKTLNNLEAAHIQPKAQAGTFLPCNGVALCRDMHWAFDKGFITISDDYRVIVHEEMRESILSEIDGIQITVPQEPYFQPEKKFLKHHRENIFGLFVHSGAIRSN